MNEVIERNGQDRREEKRNWVRLRLGGLVEREQLEE